MGWAARAAGVVMENPDHRTVQAALKVFAEATARAAKAYEKLTARLRLMEDEAMTALTWTTENPPKPGWYWRRNGRLFSWVFVPRTAHV